MGETTKEGMIVRKIILVFALFLSLVACSKPSQGLEKVTNVPDSIQEHVNYQHRLQSVRDKDGGSYLVFHSNGEATVDFTIDGKMVRIQFTETNVMDDGVAVVPHAKQNQLWLFHPVFFYFHFEGANSNGIFDLS